MRNKGIPEVRKRKKRDIEKLILRQRNTLRKREIE